MLRKMLRTPKGMKLRQLKEWIAPFPDTDPDTGEDYEVWMSTGSGRSGPVSEAWPLNKGDILLSVTQTKGER